MPAPSHERAARRLILASTSPYRRELLQRLQLPFESQPPGVDETPSPREAPQSLALRLARAKAAAVAQRHPQAVVIGSDQVAEVDGDGTPLGKPGTHERAAAQLRRMSGRTALFHTAVALECAATGWRADAVVCTEVRFRSLSSGEIERYLLAERPYDCAGSARSEALGIALVDAIRSDDPTALVGLPLIATARLLRSAGFLLP